MLVEMMLVEVFIEKVKVAYITVNFRFIGCWHHPKKDMDSYSHSFGIVIIIVYKVAVINSIPFLRKFVWLVFLL